MAKYNLLGTTRLTIFIVLTLIAVSLFLSVKLVTAKLTAIALWNTTSHQNETNHCSLHNINSTDGKGVIAFTGDASFVCRIQLNASPKTSTYVEIQTVDSSSGAIMYAERLDELRNCKNKYSFIAGSKPCVSVFRHPKLHLSLKGYFSIYISEIESSGFNHICPDDYEEQITLSSRVSNVKRCQIDQYYSQMYCATSTDNVCHPNFPAHCNASLGYGNVQFHCDDSSNIYSSHKALLMYPINVIAIDLARKNVIEIHEKHFLKLNSLVILILDYNSLTSLYSSTFKDLIALNYLSLKENRISTLGVGIFKNLARLTFLSLADNELTSLQVGLFNNLTYLRKLYLSDNKLVRLHEDIFSDLNSLTVLKLNGNKLTDLPANILKDLRSLTVLYFGRNQIGPLAGDLFNWTSKLEYLSAGDNNLTVLPNEIFRGLRNLKIVKLYRCQLKGLPHGLLKGLGKLETLHVYQNQINSLDEDLFDEASNLKDVSFGDNSLRVLPKGLFNGLKNIIKIKFYRNKITILPNGILKGLRSLRYLTFTDNQIEVLDKNLFNETRELEYLSLIDNKLSVLPEVLFKGLVNLKSLLLDRNNIMSLEEDLFSETNKLQTLQILDNSLQSIPKYLFRGSYNLKDLRLFKNQLVSLDSRLFQNLTNLNSLYLFLNNVTSLPCNLFKDLRNIEILRLENNSLTNLDQRIFHGLRNLEILFLSNNSISSLPGYIFRDSNKLKLIDLSGNTLTDIPRIINLDLLELFIIHNNAMTMIGKDTFSWLHEKTELIVSQEEICLCYISDDVNCTALEDRSPYLTCNRLLSDRILMVIMWLIGLNAIGGNLFVLRWNKVKSDRDKVQSVLLSNLATSDLLMGIYMIIIASADIYFGADFPMQAETWRSGITCRIAGTISILSSEASVFFVTFISIDRFIHIKYPFTQWKLGKKSAGIIAAILWTISLVLGIVPSSLAGRADKFYDNSHVCVGLPLAKIQMFSKDIYYKKIHPYPDTNLYYFKPSALSTSLGYESGMYFAIAMFLGLNCICYLIVLLCYIEIVRSVLKSSRRVGLHKESKEQIRMTVKVAAVVLTDFFCWFPIIILGILVQADVLILPPSVFAWCVTFVLPINSAINPYLYTISAVISNRAKQTPTSRPRAGTLLNSQKQVSQKWKTSSTQNTQLIPIVQSHV